MCEKPKIQMTIRMQETSSKHRDYHFRMPMEYVAIHQHDPFSLHMKLEGPWAMTIQNRISISQPVAP